MAAAVEPLLTCSRLCGSVLPIANLSGILTSPSFLITRRETEPGELNPIELSGLKKIPLRELVNSVPENITEVFAGICQ